MDISTPSVSFTEAETPSHSAQAEGPVGSSSLEPTIQDILANALKNERLLAESRRADAEAQARKKRAYEAWMRVASFKGERADQYAGKLVDGYTELIMDLGKVLKTDGWEPQLQAVKPGSHAKTFAVATLCQAMNGNTAAVLAMVDGAVKGLFALGLEADNWLREGLMYEVLQIDPPIEPPLDWEGENPGSIETVADFANWIWLETWTEPYWSDEHGNQPSTGSKVRNAYRLVDHLGLKGVPPEPEGPFTLHREATILRNLRRQCLLQENEFIAAAAPFQESEGAEEGDNDQTADRGR
jgi:hypothetical protein